jgi:hypothetical protein
VGLDLEIESKRNKRSSCSTRARRIDSIRERQDGFCVCPVVPLHMCTPVSDQGPNSFLGDLCKLVITHALKLMCEVVSTAYLLGNPFAARAFLSHVSLIGILSPFSCCLAAPFRLMRCFCLPYFFNFHVLGSWVQP